MTDHHLDQHREGQDQGPEHRRDKRVAISILDPDNVYRHVAIRGEVAEITENGADAHIDAMAKKYLGKDRYPFRSPSEVRVILQIRPVKVATMG